MVKKTDYFNKIVELDMLRNKRCGVPEFILSGGKSPQLIWVLLVKMAKDKGFGVATRLSWKQMSFLRKKKIKGFVFDLYHQASMAILRKRGFKFKNSLGPIGVISAGSSDVRVAEEARITAEILGCRVIYAYDVGIAGIHRIVNPLKTMLKEKVVCIIVCAGMDGILPVLVKSLVDIPVIGVPVSEGYGYGEKGESALMTMLQSCSPGLVVVNIDNGFGAATAAYLIAKKA